MTKERGEIQQARMPGSAQEQLNVFRQFDLLQKDSDGFTYRDRVCQTLDSKIRFRLGLFGVKTVSAGFRSKTIESMEKKIGKRRPDFLIADGFGVRHIFATEGERTFAGMVVQSIFPLTPKVFPNGMPTFRDYAKPEIKDLIRANFNPNIYQQGSALHANFVFALGGQETLCIGEYQAMTEAEYKIYKETHGEYKNGKF